MDKGSCLWIPNEAIESRRLVGDGERSKGEKKKEGESKKNEAEDCQQRRAMVPPGET